jgi:hypothetical protein
MTPADAERLILDALADLPSGPPGEEVLAVLMAAAWQEGYEAKGGEYPFGPLARSPYRSIGDAE